MKTQIMLFPNLLFVASMFVLVLNSVEAADNVRCREDERRALMEFKAGVVDDYGMLSSWGNNSKECCNWRGIRCSNRTHHVTLLNLPGAITWLMGYINPSLSELKHLKYLNLSHNQFDGEFPPQLGNLTNLRSLDLAGSGFFLTVENLDWVSRLHRLTHLDLSDADLSRCNDWLNQIYKLSSLTHLNLYGCNLPDLFGPINMTSFPAFNSLVVADLSFNFFSSPKSYNWLFNFTTTLVSLDLTRNSFKSEIPEAIGRITSLESLSLYDCGLEGTLPDSFRNLSRLVTLYLDSNYFNGSLSDFLHPLATKEKNSLQVLKLNLNQLHGSLPEYFTRFTSLREMLISNNNLSGLFPHNYWQLSASLVHLDLSHNQITGPFPDNYWQLPSRLVHLDLSYNQITGPFPDKFWPLPSRLVHLDLSYNQIIGPFPDKFWQLPSRLVHLDLSYNQITGPFPDKFWQLSSGVVHLDLSYNQITGPLPNLTLFSSLGLLSLKNNKLEGTIPETYLSNLSKLTILDLSFNSLSLKFSDNWVPPFQLGKLYLDNCTLGPHFPSWLQSQRKLSVLLISSAGISDTIPLWFWDILPRVEYLNISHNNIQGTLPDLSFTSVFDFVGEIIDMSYNNLTGPIPKLPRNIGSLDLSQNIFTGSLSFLCTASYPNLVSIRLSNNQLSGELPECWISVQGMTGLCELNLANNSFSGKLSASIGLLSSLQILQLRSNNLSGELPLSLMNCTELRLLDLSENEFSGEVPTWIGTHLTELIIFSLGKNKFFGRIPPQICLLTYVQVLDLSRNNFSRSIPNCVNNFSALVHYDRLNDFGFVFLVLGGDYITTVPNAYVQWKGQESLYGRHTLGLLKLIDFSSNRLVGKIPEELGSLKGLMSLNLSNNNLNGKIIQNIGQMSNLEVLDLSENNLSGEIPASLSNLTFLDVLDLSENKLRGRIPYSTQLQTFGPSSYAGNDKLCGLPLLDKCPTDGTKVFSLPGEHGSDEHKEDYEDRFITMWFYISLVLGFITGFWGFIGPVMLRSTWRRAYSRFLEEITDWIYVTASMSMGRLQRKIYG